MEIKKINIACEEVVKYNESGDIELCKPNLNKYPIYNIGDGDIYEEYSRYNPIAVYFKNCDNWFELKTLDYLIKNNQTFIYPIFLYDYSVFEIDVIDLSDDIVTSIKNNNSKIIFIEHVEGAIHEKYIFKWISDLSEKYKLPIRNIILISSNLKITERFNSLVERGLIKNNFSVYPFNYFANEFWFTEIKGNLMCKDFREFISEKEIKINKLKIKNHFLCFNRVPRIHRVCIFGELMTNPLLIGKSITTLGSVNLINKKEPNLSYVIESSLSSDYEDKNRLLEFFNSYDALKEYRYDNDLSQNQAEIINISAHNESFINIVTETIHHQNYIFFSEKTYKPIYAKQPFIILGGPHYLKTLKKHGYRTFGEWWDESYDNEIDFTKRFKKIVSLLEEISKWSLERCEDVRFEMRQILNHNYKVMIDNKESIKLYNYLEGKTNFI